jgi:hypothetical protein
VLLVLPLLLLSFAHNCHHQWLGLQPSSALVGWHLSGPHTSPDICRIKPPILKCRREVPWPPFCAVKVCCVYLCFLSASSLHRPS